LANERVLGLRVGAEMIDRDHHRQAEAAHIDDMAIEIGEARRERA